MDIRTQFNRIAETYDAGRRKFIPCFEEYYIGSTELAAKLVGSPRRILDLGAGTGLLTMYWRQHFPEAEYVLTDIADEMLEIARRRFAGAEKVSFAVSDYTGELPAGPFDAVISALSIHHLADAQKEELFRRIHETLPEGGWLLNYDQFSSADETLNALQERRWRETIEASTLSEEEISRWLERKKMDRECSVEAELAMLRRSGFAMAECFFLSGKFAVIAARKRYAN